MELDTMFLKRTPPSSLEAERTVLGGILVQTSNLNVVLSTISPEDLYKDAHRKILERIVSLVDRGLAVDLLTLTEDAQRAGILEEVGGASYLASLLDGVPRNLNVEYYAQIIKEKALLRRLILSSSRIIQDSYDQKEDADELLNAAQTAIVEIAEQRIKPGFRPLSLLTGPALETIRMTAARKEAAALGLNIAHHVGLKTDKTVGFFSMEMSESQIVNRLLCAEAQIDIQKTRNGYLSDRDFEKLKLAGEALSRAHIFIDESPALTIMEMKAKCRRLKMEQRLDIAFVDYIQLMRTGGRFENRNQEMSFISRSLKELAKELHMPVVGISQLSRAPEKGRREPKPMLSDLRESGAIEQDADVVIFIYRPEFYHRDDESVRGIAEVSVAKQRNGPIGDIRLAFIREYARFADMEQSAPDY